MSRFNIKKIAWARTYHERMHEGLERCRKCGHHGDDQNQLTFGHLIPMANSGDRAFRFDNITILCESCNKKQGAQIWPELISLLAEELVAPPDRRWGLNANACDPYELLADRMMRKPRERRGRHYHPQGECFTV